MPTAPQYRGYADALSAARDAVATLMQPISTEMETSPFTGGTTNQVLYTTLNVTSENVRAVLAELGAQIDEAYRRASVCEGYTYAMTAHYRDSEANDRPDRPAEWAEVGW